MLKKINKIVVVGLLCLQLLACGKASVEFEAQEEFVTPGEEVMPEQSEEEDLEKGVKKEEILLLSVHVCGAVKNPGVYQVEKETRIYRLVEMAGGFLEEADQNYLNLAQMAEDGMQIRVPTKEEAIAYGQSLMAADTSLQQGGKVDINKADEALLCTLPGIGESRAKSIIAYRQEHGGFQAPEDIMKISGIKEAAYEKIKDYITVSK